MRKLLSTAVAWLVALLSWASCAQAQVFKCQEGGKTVYSQAPCGAAAEKIDARPAAGGGYRAPDPYTRPEPPRPKVVERAPPPRQDPSQAQREIEAEYLRLRKAAGLGPPAPEAVVDPTSQSKALSSPKIAPGALSTYTRASYPKTFQAWGDAGVARIMEHERRAALLVAGNPACDRVEMVGLASQSMPPNHIVSFIDCTNGQRFVVSADELARGQTKSEAQRNTIRDSEAIVMCHEAARSRLKFPSSADFGIFSNSTYRAPSSGAILVQADFKAMNGFGIVIPQRAQCVIDADGQVSVDITAR